MIPHPDAERDLRAFLWRCLFALLIGAALGGAMVFLALAWAAP
jgi:hypothetical protein